MWRPTDRAVVYEIENAMRNLDDAIVHEISQSMSIRNWVEKEYGPNWEFPSPTICLLNGKPLLRKDWGTLILPNDTVTFVRVAGWSAFFVALFVGIAVSIYFASNMPEIGDTDAADSVYNLSGQRNKNRLGQAIESGYGQCRLFPSIASSSYTKFINNDQWFYGLYSLGHGLWQIDDPDNDIQIEDTPIGNFSEIEYELYDVGEEVTLFRDNVDTSDEVGEIELLAPNDPDVVGSEWSDWIVANGVGTQCDILEFDFVWPRGVYWATKKGGLTYYSIWVEMEYREIDDTGTPTGVNTGIVALNVNLATNTPVRRTRTVNTPANSRYEVRCRRSTDEQDSTRVAELTQWVGLKAYLKNHATYPVQTIAMKAKATNNLNDRAANRLNVWGTRKLPIWNGATWSAPTATRSIVWAFCDVWTAEYGANIPDTYLDLDELLALDTLYTSRGEYFDWVFDKNMSTWEAAKLIAGVGRAEPSVVGSKISMVRDSVKTAPIMLFNKENIIKGTFSIEATFPSLIEEDGLEVEFIDPDTRLPEQVLCVIDPLMIDDVGNNLVDDEGNILNLIGAEYGENPRQIKIPGIQDATHAIREGYFRWARERTRRTFASFEVGAEGYLLTRFDAIGVSHDLPRWSDGGYVKSVAGNLITLSKNVVFGSGQTYQIGFGKDNGELHGPFTCTAGWEPDQVVVAGFDDSELSLTDNREPSKFCFGKTSEWSKLCVVNEREAVTRDRVKLSVFVYDDFPHSFDDEFAPDYVSLTRRNATIPAVTSLQIYHLPDNLTFLRIAWNWADAATDYVVMKSTDGTTFELVTITKNNWHDMQVSPGDRLWIRVAGLNGGVGAWNTVGPKVVGVAFDNLMIDDVANVLVDDSGMELYGYGGDTLDIASFVEATEQLALATESLLNLDQRVALLESNP